MSLPSRGGGFNSVFRCFLDKCRALPGFVCRSTRFHGWLQVVALQVGKTVYIRDSNIGVEARRMHPVTPEIEQSHQAQLLSV